MPRSFRGEESGGYPDPDSVFKYKARSMLQEHRGLAIVFGILALALTAYFIKSVLSAPKPEPPPSQSVYIEAIPPKEPSPAR